MGYLGGILKAQYVVVKVKERWIPRYDPLRPVDGIKWRAYLFLRGHLKTKNEEWTVVYTFWKKGFFQTLKKNT